MKIQQVIGAAMLVVVATTAHAQLPEAGAASFSMAGNFMAAATGYEAPAFNPAMLGIRAPKFSISLFSLGGNTGLDPVKLNDITKFDGAVIPASTKEEWLQRIGSGGRERGSADGGLSIVALSVGHVAFQAGIVGSGQMSINQDAAEALLYGNAGRTGVAKPFNFSGSNANGSGFATGAVSIGIPISSTGTGTESERTFALGVTGKMIRGLGAGRAFDNGSIITPDNIKVSFPSLYTDDDEVGNAGSGVGLDLGFAYTSGHTTYSGAVRNVVNTFEWETSTFRSNAGTVNFDGTVNKTDFNKQPYASAPAALRTALEEEKFKPEIAAGIAYEMHSLLVTADASQRMGDGIELGPKMRVGAGIEYSGLPILRLRGGVAAITGGFQAATGVGLKLGRVELGVGISTRSGDNGTETGAMFTLFSVH